PTPLVMEGAWNPGWKRIALMVVVWVIYMGMLMGLMRWVGPWGMLGLALVQFGILGVMASRMPRSLVAEVSDESLVVNSKLLVGRSVKQTARRETAELVVEWKPRRKRKRGLKFATIYAVDGQGKRKELAWGRDLRGIQAIVEETRARWG